ncbi:hypothetical protein Vretimale_5975 [Volvox reticuliferus]|uniref:Uncharacterized protein n=1 Tax=Volvox reticuliferus TaxID=1737510 RepID=A0A8J4FM43_9CHLO|nr:hypothetical protein Vretifemale_6021 [Volvox reticuliferus]GIM01139.1 hypothetical protein Vretimale_5975 [Volvox reticuliferus]
MADPEAEVEYKNESDCLILEPDNSGSTITKVTFARSVPDVHARVAELLKLPETERVRCFHLPMFEKVLGWSVHMYLDLDAVEHGMHHNTNATQLWLIANLPTERCRVAAARGEVQGGATECTVPSRRTCGHAAGHVRD